MGCSDAWREWTPGWKKPHLGVDATGEIVAQVLTDSKIDDGSTVVAIIEDVGDLVGSVIADVADDTGPVYDTAESRGAKVVMPPSSKASASGRRGSSMARDQAIRRVKELGRRRWKKDLGHHHRQARVENTFFRQRTVLGGRLRVRALPSRETGTRVAGNVLYRMRALG